MIVGPQLQADHSAPGVQVAQVASDELGVIRIDDPVAEKLLRIRRQHVQQQAVAEVHVIGHGRVVRADDAFDAAFRELAPHLFDRCSRHERAVERPQVPVQVDDGTAVRAASAQVLQSDRRSSAHSWTSANKRDRLPFAMASRSVSEISAPARVSKAAPLA